MKRKNLIIMCLSLLLCSFASAAIVITGAVYPTDPLNWNEYENGHIGDYNEGSVVMDAGTDALECQ